VIRFDHGDRTFAVYRSPDDRYDATDGFCTHAQTFHLDRAGRLVCDATEGAAARKHEMTAAALTPIIRNGGRRGGRAAA